MSAARVGDVVAFASGCSVVIGIDGDAVRLERVGSRWIDDGTHSGHHIGERTGDVHVMPAWIFFDGLRAGYWRVESTTVAA